LYRFKRTPLEDAVRGDYVEVAKLLLEQGGCVYQKGKMVPLADSELAGVANLQALGLVAGFEGLDLEPEWELDPSELKIQDKIGHGEFGTVYKAKWRGSYVAVKVLNSSDRIALGDFRTEITVLRRVHHPNAVQMLGACTRKVPYMLVTEYVPGGSLADIFKMKGQLTVRRVVEMCLDIARGMAYLHANSKSIIHRDLKPSNILIGGSFFNTPQELAFHTGIIKIGDFGLSKSLPIHSMEESRAGGGGGGGAGGEEEGGGEGGHTHTDSYRLTGGTGSYRYMAPEVFRHEPYNNKVDVYSFGMIMYQLIEGVVPFCGTKPVQAAYNAAKSGVRPTWKILNLLPKSAHVLRTVIEHCWAEDPGRRPSFEQIVDALENIIVNMPEEDHSWLYSHLRGGGQKVAPTHTHSQSSSATASAAQDLMHQGPTPKSNELEGGSQSQNQQKHGGKKNCSVM